MPTYPLIRPGQIPTEDQKAAMDAAASPSGANAFATMADVGGAGDTGVQGDTGVPGMASGYFLFYEFDTTVGGNPAVGDIRLAGNSDPSLATHIHISETDHNSVNVDSILDGISVGDTIKLFCTEDATIYHMFEVTGTFSSTGSPAYDPIPVSWLVGGGTFTAAMHIGFATATKGAKGDTGTTGDTGLKGDTGIDGDKGDTGIDGLKGDTGDDSTVPGPKGDTGVKPAGQIYVSAAGMWPSATAGAQTNTRLELATNKVNIYHLAFDTTTQEYAEFGVVMPSDWNAGVITASFYWTHPSTSTNFGVVWNLAGRSYADDDALDQAQGTAQQIADTGGTTSDLYITSATPDITITGATASEYVQFRVSRVVGDAADNMAVDAQLLGVMINYTRTA